MGKKVTTVLDGRELKLVDSLDVEPNRRYRVTIEEIPEPAREENAWGTLRSLAGSVEAPEDWASEHDHYLYSTPKREP